MEEPSYSSLNNTTIFSKEQSSSEEEESGWTSYFEDFMASEKRKTSEEVSSRSCSSSLHDCSSLMVLSDAASCTAWKPHRIAGKPSRSFANLSLKREKGRSILEDDSLEDTASSPVNSPKDKMSGYGDYKELASEGIKETNYEGMVDNCSELRKQGLCLVPVSMLANYLG